MANVVFISSTLLAVIEIWISAQLILRKKNNYATISEVLISFVLQSLYLGALNFEWWKIITVMVSQYIIVKTILVIAIMISRIASFYIIKRLAMEKRSKTKSKFSKTFGNSKWLKRVKKVNQISYFPRLKLGLPGMANQVHGVTKVHFDKKGFPIFKSKYKVKLKISDCRRSRDYHFTVCNRKLLADIQVNSNLRKKLNLSKNDIKLLKEGKTPSHYVWHHHQNMGVLQLVDRVTHEKTFHKGGFSIWGGKNN